jgi:hypothetical protein
VSLTLFEAVTSGYRYAGRKHNLGENYDERAINQMTNFELLQAISDGLEELEADRERQRPSGNWP